MYAHPGTWREADTVRRGYELNYRLLAIETSKHPGAMQEEHSFFEVQAENVVMTAIKKAEDDGSLILRFYEWAGKESDVKIVLPVGAQSASETDLMERPIGDLAVPGGVLAVHTKPYEIKTIRVRFARE
jgi:alpha-mannosidase